MSRDGPQRRQGPTEKKEGWSGAGALKRPSIRAFLPPEKEAGIHEVAFEPTRRGHAWNWTSPLLFKGLPTARQGR